MAPSIKHRTFKYAFTPKEQNHRPATPPTLETGKVLIVRGRSATEVYHTWRDCNKLRGVTRTVKETYARAAGMRPCNTCTQPHQLTLETTGVPA